MAYVRISSSLLDAYWWYQNAGSFYADKTSDDLRNEWLDKLRGVRTPPSAAQARGTKFEEDVCNRTLIELGPKPKVADERYNEAVLQCSELFQGAHTQEHVSRTLDGRYLLHGFIDFLTPLVIVDLKTTSKYTFPKYLANNQQWVYLYCMGKLGYRHFCYAAFDFKEMHFEWYHAFPGFEEILVQRIHTMLDDINHDCDCREAFYDIYQKKETNYGN